MTGALADGLLSQCVSGHNVAVEEVFMSARLAGLFTISMLTMGAAMGPVFQATPARERQAASRLARDGDLQADWNTLLDAHARLEGLVQHRDIFWWVSRVAMPQADRPALTTCEDGPARTRSTLVRVRLSFVVPEWLEAVWAAIQSMIQQGDAWSREFLFSRG